MDSKTEFYERFIEPIRGRMLSLVGRIIDDPDDAADALQDALERVWRRADRIARHVNPRGYILRVCASSAYDALRRRARQCRREVGLKAEASSAENGRSSGRGAEILRRRIDVLAAIGRLPRRQGEALLLRVVDGQSFDEIGRAMGCSAATARSHVSKARARLRVILDAPDTRLSPEVKANEPSST